MAEVHPSITMTKDRWSRLVVNWYWMTLGLIVLGQVVIFFVGQQMTAEFEPLAYIVQYMLVPDIAITVILVGLEAITRKIPEYRERAIFVTGLLFAICMTLFISPRLPGALIILILPLLSSMLMLKKSYIYICLSVSYFYLILLFIAIPERQNVASICEMIIVAFVLVATAMTGSGVITRGLELFHDIDKSHKSVQELLVKNAMMDRTNKTDALTELYNHKTYHEYIERLIEQQQRSEFPLQVAMMDVDNFKKVNDTYGHWVGDIVLRRVAEIIRAHMEADDFAARYGGEEFIILLTSKTMEQSLMVVETIRKAVAEVIFEELNQGRVTISVGLHDFQANEDKEAFFRKADAALYEAKKTGKNRTVII
ncbi:diguanylate cyclase (GGDEF)-like protein [Paenibacillus phyllosphaerae]|uniref:Diguanylate cyclase (GGDEF)-like protein n=1 Tax=Paenibacillus phyllosphaerae TaxID=274593 RepID=A0A7W5FQR7_9BACL|nr:GGDEF domain-containing protein [Paenibacillus phyllosphaerae]MBB3113578.1 diguanylate cyclase (GGDEF)-like protein [Paenibacillus phyllosphaerae]